jgi:hypothetical protein
MRIKDQEMKYSPNMKFGISLYKPMKRDYSFLMKVVQKLKFLNNPGYSRALMPAREGSYG